jgi:hypothetical protein
LYELQEKLTLPADLPQGVHAAAAIGENCLALMLVNHADTPVELAVECPAVLTRCRITDETHDWEETSRQSLLPPTSILLLEFEL